ncbi:MAG: class I SAM-dependent methyltransferase, partial [Verrucomicrobiota bacterium]|nr:class I SAM-dependent methyltransferase [Verrucomicrobiota bacterium]
TAPDFFKKCYAIDLGENLLAQIKDKYPSCFLAAADAENLPFHNDSFNAVSCYAMLHHLYSHKKLLEESYRVLKKSGILYTDHDPNYFLNRFYHIFYKLRYQKNPGFGSDAEELAEYHNACSSGINPVKLKEQLLAIGFSQVEISYRITDRPNWNTTMKLTVNILKILSKIIPAKSFFTHFSIIAIK